MQLSKEILCRFVVKGGARSVKNIERNANAFEGFSEQCIVFINHFLRGQTLFHRPNRDGSPVFVRAADPHNLLAHQAQVTHIHVRTQVRSRKMPNVQRSVGVR